MADLLYESQYFTTTLSVAGGIDDSQTTGIVLQAVTGISEPTKPGLTLLSYADPLDTTDAEWITYTSVNTTTKELAGVTRGAEGSSAKAHDNGVAVAFPHSMAHINRINDKLTGEDTGVTLDTPTLTSPTVTSPTITAATIGISAMNQGWDGWIAATDTWTYASATTFTIAGVDRTAMFPKGTKIKLTQTSAKYFYVVASAFSTNTTITVTGGSDYTLDNEAITLPNYSYAETPQGFPGQMTYTVSWTGFSSPPASLGKFYIKGNNCFVNISCSTNGTSNATTHAASLPVTAATVSGIVYRAYALVVDNNVVIDGSATVSSGGTQVGFCKAADVVTFTGSGNKSGNTQITYGF